MRIDIGIFAALGAALLFGASTPLAKLLLVSQSPLLLAGLLYLGSGIGITLILLLRRQSGRQTPLRWPSGADGLWLGGAIICGGVLGPYLLMLGLTRTDAATAALTLNLEGVFTALLAWFVFGENVDRRIAFGMSLITAGGFVLSAGPALHGGALVGPMAIGAACLAWGLDNNLTRKASAADALVVAGSKGLLAGTTSLGLALISGSHLPTARIALAAGALGFLGYGISLALFVIALRHLGAARTGAYFALAPFIGAALALFLGAPATWTIGLAALLMTGGVWLHLTERHAHLHDHERLEHEHPHRHDLHHQHEHPDGWSGAEPHTHAHVHEPQSHTHAHYPDIHHRHGH